MVRSWFLNCSRHWGRLALLVWIASLVAASGNLASAAEDSEPGNIPVWMLPPEAATEPVNYVGSWQELEDGKGRRLMIDGQQLVEELQLFVQLEQAGGTEVWVDGQFLGNAGQPGANLEEEQAVLRNEIPFPLTVSSVKPVLLELKHSTFAAEKISGITGQSGELQLRLISPALWMRELQKQNDEVRAPLLFFIAVPGMLALLHFSFAGLRVDRTSNLTVGAFLLSLAALSAVRLVLVTTVSVDAYITAYRGFLAMIPVVSILGLRTVYGLLKWPHERIFKGLAVLAGPVLIYGFWAVDYTAFRWVGAFGLLCSLEIFRISAYALKNGQTGSKLIFGGMAVFAIAIAYNALRIFEVVPDFSWSTHSFNFGVLVLAFMLSLHVARDYAQTSRRLALKLTEVQELGEENLRREHEKQALIASQNERLEIEVKDRTQELRESKDKSDQLLENILPAEVASELKLNGRSEPRRFEEVTMLFSDFRGFTSTVSSIPVGRLISELNEMFSEFDELAKKYGLEKIKTIGDAYMAAAGLPETQTDHAIRATRLAHAMLAYTRKRNESSAIKWGMRIGLHSGPVVAGVVGSWKFTYDVFGDTVNLASRMESVADTDQVCVSAYTYDLIKETFPGDYRGKVEIKGKGELDVYQIPIAAID